MDLLAQLLAHQKPCWIGGLGSGSHFRCDAIHNVEANDADTAITFADRFEADPLTPVVRTVMLSSLRYVADTIQLDTLPDTLRPLTVE